MSGASNSSRAWRWRAIIWRRRNFDVAVRPEAQAHFRLFLDLWKQADPELPELQEARRLRGR